MTLTPGLATPADMPAVFALRDAVFCQEQGVPQALEVDGLDDLCHHVVLYDGPELIGTARLRDSGGEAKAERVCVARHARGQGSGAALMRALEQLARDLGHSTLHLHAQVAVIPFYTALGYTASGPVFDDAGIPHRAMHRTLSASGSAASTR